MVNTLDCKSKIDGSNPSLTCFLIQKKILKMNHKTFHLFQLDNQLFLSLKGPLGRVGIELLSVGHQYQLGKVSSWLNQPNQHSGNSFYFNFDHWNQFYKHKLIFESKNKMLPFWDVKSFLKFWDVRRQRLHFGYSTQLQVVGIGYKFQILEDQLQLFLGKSHIIKLNLPNQVHLHVPSKQKDQRLVIFGLDKLIVKSFRSKIRSIFLPEVYKGKGIRYMNEQVFVKTNKKN